MPNICSYQLKITGKTKESVLEFAEICKSNYSYDKMELPERHFSRVFEADYDVDTIEEFNGVYELVISGCCAWSFKACFMDGLHTYYNYILSYYRDKARVTNIKRECRRLNLFVEAFSEESGCEFQEHVICTPKGMLKNEVADISEMFNEEGDRVNDDIGFDWEYESFYLSDFEKYKPVHRDRTKARKRHKRKLKKNRR